MQRGLERENGVKGWMNKAGGGTYKHDASEVLGSLLLSDEMNRHEVPH